MSAISRVTRSKAAAKASYDKMSGWYDALSGSSEKKFRDIGLQQLNVHAGETALEIGFGTGHALVALARAVGETGKVYGVDLSEGMWRMASERIHAAGFSNRVELTCRDALHLPFAENFFDAVFMSFTLELFDTPEIPAVLSECRRVLRQGGRIGVVSLSKIKNNSAIKLYEWFHARLPAVVDCRPIFAQQSLEACNFRILETSPMSMWGLSVEIVLAQK
jgi:ubiquinone/menaquinone biosynthesis C-methylase UbiE